MHDSFSAVVRAYLAPSYLVAAAQFAREAKEFEEAQQGGASREVMHYAIGSVMCSLAYLEGLINSMLSDAASGNAGTLREDQRAILAKLWPLVERSGVLEKYQVTLQFLANSEIDRGASVWDNAGALVALRNALVHFKPESETVLSTIPQQPVEGLPIERRLVGKFAPNPWYSDIATAFYLRYLSHGCAAWAVDSALQFSEAFYEVLGLPFPYEENRSDFATA